MADEFVRIESESGVIASLIQNPEFAFYSEHLLPNHFHDADNRYIYLAITELAKNGISNIDPYNIIEVLSSAESTRRYSQELSVDRLHELVDMSEVIARRTVEEYKLAVDNVLDAAFRRDTLKRLKDCVKLVMDPEATNIEQQIYNALDDVMMEFSSNMEVPQYSDVIDGYWSEIVSRQGVGYAGTPFKFPTLNEYVTIEPGELVVFGAEAKQGKSMLLLNCAVDLLRQDMAVLYLDSELNTRMFTARLLSHLSGVEYKSLTAGAYGPEEEAKINEAREWLKTRKFVHLYLPLFDSQSIYTSVKKIKHTMGLDVLVVDYFKSRSDGDAFDSYQELGRFVDLVKNQICGDMNIAGIGAAQATATGKLADSAKIARNASTIIMLQDKTPDEVETDGPECGNKKMRVILNRNGMQHAQGEYISLYFDGNHVLYEEAKQAIPNLPY